MNPAKTIFFFVIGAGLIYALYSIMKKATPTVLAGAVPILTSAGVAPLYTAAGAVIPRTGLGAFGSSPTTTVTGLGAFGQPPGNPAGPSTIFATANVPGTSNPSEVTGTLPLSGFSNSSVYGSVDDPGIQAYMMDNALYD